MQQLPPHVCFGLQSITFFGVFGAQDLLSNTEIREKQAVSNAEALKAAHVEALSSRHKSQQNAEEGSTAYRAMADRLSALESHTEYAKKESADLEVVLKQSREVLKDAQAEVAVRESPPSSQPSPKDHLLLEMCPFRPISGVGLWGSANVSPPPPPPSPACRLPTKYARR